VAGDAAKAKFAAAMMLRPPVVQRVHLSSLDERNISTARPTEARANIARWTAFRRQLLIAAVRKVQPDMWLALVSDHGFAPISHDVNLIPHSPMPD